MANGHLNLTQSPKSNENIPNSPQYFLRILRAIFDYMARCHLLPAHVADDNIFGFVCANRIRSAVGGGHSIDGHFNIDQHAGSDVAVEYNTECGFPRQFGCGGYQRAR